MTHSYPLTSLYGDYLRTLIGLVFMGVPFYFALGNLFMTIVFGSLTLLFVIFGVRTGIRHVITIETSPQGSLQLALWASASHGATLPKSI